MTVLARSGPLSAALSPAAFRPETPAPSLPRRGGAARGRWGRGGGNATPPCQKHGLGALTHCDRVGPRGQRQRDGDGDRIVLDVRVGCATSALALRDSAANGTIFHEALWLSALGP